LWPADAENWKAFSFNRGSKQIVDDAGLSRINASNFKVNQVNRWKVAFTALASVLIVVIVTFGWFFFGLWSAQKFSEDLIKRMASEGNTVQMPKLAPAAEAYITSESANTLLSNMKSDGPILGISGSKCLMVPTSNNICPSSLAHCDFSGTLPKGKFEATIVLCSSGIFGTWQLEGVHWNSQIRASAADKAPI
jgi:hypothetical protein